MPQMTYFEKLSFCIGGNLQSLSLIFAKLSLRDKPRKLVESYDGSVFYIYGGVLSRIPLIQIITSPAVLTKGLHS